MQRFAIRLLSYRKSLLRFRFSTQNDPKNAQKPQQPKQEQKEQVYRRLREENDDDQQPKYQRQDRTTKGWIIYRIIFWTSASLLAYNTYLVSQHKKKTPVEQQAGAIPGFIGAAKFIYKNYCDAQQFFTKPPLDKLMPDVLHPGIQPKTLVLNVSGTLLSTQYVFGKGLVVHKRPGLQQFLKKVSQQYEVIIFSDDDSMLLNTLVPSLDPRRQIIAGCFGHECMVLKGGKSIKDLKYLNRDLRKVIVIDKNKAVADNQKQNVITLSEYKGDETDQQLTTLAGLLSSLATQDVKDVRKVLQQMGQNPVKTYQARMKQLQEKFKKKQEKASGWFSFKEKKN